MKSIITKTALIIVGAVFLSSPLVGEVVEKIAAVVGERVILASEVASQVQMYMFQLGPDTDVDPQQLAQDILQEMISDELILTAAKDDTTIFVAENELQAELDDHIASLVSRFPTEEAFLEQLRLEGLTKRDLEKRFRPQIREQLLKQKIISKKLSSVTVSRQEVEDFFAVNADSLPEMSTRIKLAHILIKFTVSPQTDDSIKALIEKARELAMQGVDFAAIPESFPPGPGAPVGGRIGFIQRGEVVSEFGRAAFNLQPGTISGPVRTEYGWHIIKSHSRLEDSVDVSQVLFPVAPTATDSARTIDFADSLYREILDGADFRELAKLNSEDDASRGTGGELEPTTIDQIRDEFIEPLSAIEEGQVTAPVQSELGYHILKLLEREEGRPLNMSNDYDIIRNMARQQKTSKRVGEWVEELKQKVIVQVRDMGL